MSHGQNEGAKCIRRHLISLAFPKNLGGQCPQDARRPFCGPPD